MLNQVAFADLRTYIKRRLAYAQYMANGTWYKVDIQNIDILVDGSLRVKVDIPASGKTINCVALYNTAGDQWAYQDCNIVVSNEQTGVLFWFDFAINEGG